MANLSQSEFEQIIAKHAATGGNDIEGAAAEIWSLVAAYIEEAEHRVINAEFALQELRGSERVHLLARSPVSSLSSAP